MTSTYDANDEQARLWNGPSGQSWVEAQALLDRAFRPFEDRLVEAASTGPHRRVLDIGCGTGSTTLAVARRLGAASRCVGVDISEPMLALARTRGAHEGSPAEFIRADAQTYPFEAGIFDLVVSRFGVMFFDDPVRAFANVRRASANGAELRCIAWRSAADNPFMTTAERAAAPLLPALPARQPDAPGQFAFANPTRVHGLLAESGWSGIDIQPIDVECAFPAEADVVLHAARSRRSGSSRAGRRNPCARHRRGTPGHSTPIARRRVASGGLLVVARAQVVAQRNAWTDRQQRNAEAKRSILANE
jgi:SAM-dependent methyltransferase